MALAPSLCAQPGCGQHHEVRHSRHGRAADFPRMGDAMAVAR